MFQPENIWYQIHPEFKVSIESSEAEIIESLRHYIQGGGDLIEEALLNLSQLLEGIEEPREDIIELVLQAMKSHPNIYSVQMAGTACLYNLTREDIGPKVHPVILSRCVDLTLIAMENFPEQQQLQNNALLIIYSDHILEEVNFDSFRCSRLMMECICQFEDALMNRLSVEIFSLLTSKITIEQINILGSKECYMNKLLMLLEKSMRKNELDITLQFTVRALWNLTDETPSTCLFLASEKSIWMFMELLQFIYFQEKENHVEVGRGILSILGNISEVKSLRFNLMREDLIKLIRKMLHRKHVDISYSAAGFLANLCSEGDDAWRHLADLRSQILNDLKDVILSWDQPQNEFLSYRSFSSFFALMQSQETPLQLLAVWGIKCVCFLNGKLYLPLLDSEGGYEHINRLMMTSGLDDTVKGICQEILGKLEEHKGRP